MTLGQHDPMGHRHHSKIEIAENRSFSSAFEMLIDWLFRAVAGTLSDDLEFDLDGQDQGYCRVMSIFSYGNPYF